MERAENLRQEKLYDRKYEQGYGIRYPESHIIRIYNYLERKYRLSEREDRTLLDFGCGNGTHSVFFEEKGFRCYGVDISKRAIEQYNKNLNRSSDKRIREDQGDIRGFHIEEEASMRLPEGLRFDIILANQSLYYISDRRLQDRLGEFDMLLKEEGVVVFTMMSEANYYFSHIVKGHEKNGMSLVRLRGRLNEDAYINFVKDEKELEKKFARFEKDRIGIYDFTMEEGSSQHYYFVGRKKRFFWGGGRTLNWRFGEHMTRFICRKKGKTIQRNISNLSCGGFRSWRDRRAVRESWMWAAPQEIFCII